MVFNSELTDFIIVFLDFSFEVNLFKLTVLEDLSLICLLRSFKVAKQLYGLVCFSSYSTDYDPIVSLPGVLF